MSPCAKCYLIFPRHFTRPAPPPLSEEKKTPEMAHLVTGDLMYFGL